MCYCYYILLFYFQNCSHIFTLLNEFFKAESTASAYRATCHQLFPYATIFAPTVPTEKSQIEVSGNCDSKNAKDAPKPVENSQHKEQPLCNSTHVEAES